MKRRRARGKLIFEVRNSQGKHLLAIDLVRNNMFHSAEKQSSATDARGSGLR
jgi:uncharacterized protein with ParB-like and HNH nuclease domain